MNLNEFQEKYKNLLSENPKKSKHFTQWNHSLIDINKRFITDNENDLLIKLKDYMATWSGEDFKVQRKINKENSEILFKNEHYEKALHASFEVTKNIYKKLFDENITEFTSLDYINAQEYCMQNSYLMPPSFERKKILDIGSGFGRSLAVPSKLIKNLVYCSVDIQKEQYYSQYLVYKCFENLKLYEYFEDTKNFSVRDNPGIYHLPTLKFELIPDNFFDHVICTFVIGEIPIKLLKIFIKEIKRTLKPRGSIFIREHLNRFYNSHINLHDLLKQDFFCEFHPYLIDNKEVRGNHMIYRKKTHNYPFYNDKKNFLKDLLFKINAKFR